MALQQMLTVFMCVHMFTSNCAIIVYKFLQKKLPSLHTDKARLTFVNVPFLQQILDYDFSKFKNVAKWYAKVKSTIPNYQELTEPGIKGFRVYVDKLPK